MNSLIEVDEAIDAGVELLDAIDEILANLRNASIWGIVDLFSDSGFLTSVFKHSNLHKAQEGQDRLVYLINRFNAELDDVRVDSHLNDIAMSGGIEFCDFFFDGLIIDAFTLSRIHESRNQLLDLKDRVESILNDLVKLKEVEEI